MSSPNNGPSTLLSSLARWLKKALLALLILLPAAVAAADRPERDASANPGNPGNPSACEAPLPDLARAAELEPLCARNPRFLHRFGKLLNAAQRFAEAAERLEAALLHDPERWEVQLDFLVALEGLGDWASVESLATGLAEQPAAQAWLAEKKKRIVKRKSVWFDNERNFIGVAVGYDNNLLGATRYSTLNLTFPSSEVPVAIDKSEQQRGGRFVRVDLGRGGDLFADSDARWRYSLVASHSASIDYAPGNLSHAGARIERAPEGVQGWYGIGALQYQYRGTRASTLQSYLGGGYENEGGVFGLHCRLRWGGEFYATHYPDSAVLDGRYTGLTAQGVCPGLKIQYQFRIGQERPADTDRPGGVQDHYGVRLSHLTPFGNGWIANEFDYFRQVDSRGYSSLLDNNARRVLDRVIYRLEYRWNRPGFSPYVGFEWMDQRSNLPLFEPRNWIVTAGIRHAW